MYTVTMTHITCGIDLSCCLLNQVLHNGCVTTLSSSHQSSLSQLHMRRVDQYNTHELSSLISQPLFTIKHILTSKLEDRAHTASTWSEHCVHYVLLFIGEYKRLVVMAGNCDHSLCANKQQNYMVSLIYCQCMCSHDDELTLHDVVL